MRKGIGMSFVVPCRPRLRTVVVEFTYAEQQFKHLLDLAKRLNPLNSNGVPRHVGSSPLFRHAYLLEWVGCHRLPLLATSLVPSFAQTLCICLQWSEGKNSS